MKNISKPCYDFSVILYDLFNLCAFFAPSVNAHLIFQNLKYKTSGAQNYLQNAVNRNSLRRLVLSNNVINLFENPSPSLFLVLKSLYFVTGPRQFCYRQYVATMKGALFENLIRFAWHKSAQFDVLVARSAWSILK